jgi:acetyl-CoA carboxylase carboxyl transferase subunit alpha
MAVDTLEFEEPVALLLKEIEAMNMMPQTPERLASIAQVERRISELRADIFSRLTPWQRVLVTRHPNRPCMLDYVEHLFTDFIELHGDRRFGDDHAIVTGMGQFRGQPVFIIGHQKGRDTQQKIYRNFGYARPEGYRKALRVMKLAEKFKRPVIVFVDTPAAYPGAESEERGVAEAIALNLREMALLDTPIVVTVTGEGQQRRAWALPSATA